MKESAWARWKFWNGVPASPKRHVHLGIDYGTNTSKIVFRDYGVPGGGSAVLVVRNGSLRIPSRVCSTESHLLFGDHTKTAADCHIYESIKTRVANEVSGKQLRPPALTNTLSNGIGAADLAALTVWFLISEGHRAVAAHFDGRMQDVEMGMTMGVPMPFFSDPLMNAAFLRIARRAWTFYRDEGLLESSLLTEDARRILEKHSAFRSAAADSGDNEWIRCEGQAAIWWLLNSPNVATGPYAKVDIGASTTHANLIRIFGQVHTVRRSLVPYGEAAVPIGMEAVRHEMTENDGSSSESLETRDFEPSVPEANAQGDEAPASVCERIYDAYRKAWIDACSKMGTKEAELAAWRDHKLFLIGGGSLVPLLIDTMRIHPDRREPLTVMMPEQPIDLVRADRTKLTAEQFPFVPVAYGLSNMKGFLPNPYCRDPGSFSFGRH